MSSSRIVSLLVMGVLLWTVAGVTQESAEQARATAALEAAETRLELNRAERRQIQRSLAAAGFDPGPADGLFGRATREAIRKWQASRDEAATGYLDADAAKALLAAGSNAERPPTEGEQHARAVAETSAAEQKLSSLLERELSSMAVDENGWTDLHYAAVLNLPELVATLLDAGAHASPALKSDEELLGDHLKKILQAFGHDSFAKTRRFGQTPLHLAARQNSYDVAQLLINRGADVNETDKDKDGESGWTPLHYAAKKNAAEVAQLLLRRGADGNATSKSGLTPLHTAVRYKAREVTQLLIGHGANVNAKNDNGNTPLYIAAWNDAPDVAKLLIDHGANVNVKDHNGHTPLHQSALDNASSVAQLLIDNGANLNAKDNDGGTPLYTAAWNTAFDVTKLLIDHGANLNALRPATVKLLIDRGYGQELLDIAARNNATDVAKLLIDHGANLNAKNNSGWTPLHVAVRNKASEVAALLRRQGGRECG